MSTGPHVDRDSDEEMNLSSEQGPNTQRQIAVASLDHGSSTDVGLLQPSSSGRRVPGTDGGTLTGFLTNSQQVEVSQSTFHAQTHNAPVVHIHNYSPGPSSHEWQPGARSPLEGVSRVLNAFTSGDRGREVESQRNEREEDTSRPIEGPNVIYARHLMSQGRGFPLWTPGPGISLPIAYRTEGVSLGDVGIIVEGAFHFLFNVLLPSDAAINSGGVPDDFQPLTPAIHGHNRLKTLAFSGGSHLSSSDVSRTNSSEDPSGLTFTSSVSDGAILTMPEAVFRERLVNTTRFENYMALHAESWYRYVNGVVGLGVENGELRIVCASDKTSAWGMATFSGTSGQSGVSLKFRTVHNREQQLSGPPYVWEHSGSVATSLKTGPDITERDELGVRDGAALHNQCLFLRTLGVMLATDVWQELERTRFAATSSSPGGSQKSPHASGLSSGSHSSSLGFTGSSEHAQGSSGGIVDSESDMPRKHGVVIFETPVESRIIHPSRVINQFLLKECPHAKMAISSDRDWNWILPSTPPCHYNTSEKFIEQMCSLHNVYEYNGIARFDPKVYSEEGERQELENMEDVLKSFANGSLTVPLYLYDSTHDRKNFLNRMIGDFMKISARPSLWHKEMADLENLDGHPTRPLSLDEIVRLQKGEVTLPSILKRSISATRLELDSLPAEHARRIPVLHDLANLLLKRYRWLYFRDDLDEGICCLEEALALTQEAEYLRFEILIDLCSALYQRVQLSEQQEDITKLSSQLLNQAFFNFDAAVFPKIEGRASTPLFSIPLDTDEPMFGPLDLDDQLPSNSFHWDSYTDFEDDVEDPYSFFDPPQPDPFALCSPFDDAVRLPALDDFTSWVHDPDFSMMNSPSSLIPIASSSSGFARYEDPPFSDDAFSSDGASFYSLPRSTPPTSSSEDARSSRLRFHSDATSALRTQTTRSSIRHSPLTNVTTLRQRIQLQPGSLSSGQLFTSSSTPSHTESHTPAMTRAYSRRADSVVSGTEDPNTTVRRRKRSFDLEITPPAAAAKPTDPPLKSVLRPPKMAPSAWQLYFTDWIARQQASGTRKLNVAQAAKEAGQEYAGLSAAEKEPYKHRAQAMKEAREKELEAYMRKLTPEEIKRENAFRTAQRRAGKSRKGYLKDPNAPKKPLSAYFMFLQGVRANPSLVTEIFGEETDTTKQSVLAAAKWRSMTDAERQPFLAKAEQEKTEYEAARRAYEEGTTGFGSSTNFSILPGSPQLPDYQDGISE